MPMELGYFPGKGFDKYSATKVYKSENRSIVADILFIRIIVIMSTTRPIITHYD